MKTQIQTGEIIPRDYGITIQAKNGNKVFLSPVKYAIARVMIENPDEIKNRLDALAQIHSCKFSDIEKELKAGIKKRKNGTLSLLNSPSIENVKKYQYRYCANVNSNFSKNEKYTTILDFRSPNIEHMANQKHVCNCQDSMMSNVKNANIVCVHNAALQIGLYLDEKYKISSNDSFTKLFPRDRRAPPMPFNIAKMYTKGLSEEDKIINEILFGYFIEDKNYYELSKEILKNPIIYTPQLLELLTKETDVAKYEVYRQEEKQKKLENITESQRRFYAASCALERRIREMLEDKNFYFDGYGLEFQDTNNEIIAYRFRNHQTIYSICTTLDNPPIIIRKNLLSKISENEHKKINLPYLESEENYFSIDDSTRKECLTKIIIPGEKETSQVFIPEILKEMYGKLKQK